MSRMTIKDIECDPRDLPEIFLQDKLDIYNYLGTPKPFKPIPVFWMVFNRNSCFWRVDTSPAFIKCLYPSGNS